MTDRKRPWRVVQTWVSICPFRGRQQERYVWAYFETREHALAVKARETRRIIWSSVKWHLEHWTGERWEAVEDE